MKLKYDFVINDVAGSAVAVPVGDGADNFKGYIKLNETGAFIFKSLLNGTTDRDMIVKQIAEEFSDVTEEEAGKAVDTFLSQLAEADILDNE